MLKNVDLLIFDIDGTLLDSVKFNVENMNHTLSHFGYNYRVTEDIIRGYLGCTAEDYYRGVLDKSCVGDWEKIRAFNRANMAEAMAKYGREFEGVQETFKTLHQEDYTLVLYSNCSRPYLEAALDVIGIRPFVSYTECVKDNGLEKPKLLEKILNHYKDKQGVVVGDRIHDLEAARSNHLPCIAAMYGFGKGEMTDAKYKINHIDELKSLLKEDWVKG